MEKINEEVDLCVFCLSPKRDEVILNCKHSFCSKCMEEFCNYVTHKHRCPCCRARFSYYMKKFGKPCIIIVDSDEESFGSDSEGPFGSDTSDGDTD